MGILKKPITYVLSLLIAASPIASIPAQAGAGDVMFGAAAGMMLGAMMAGGGRHYYHRGHHVRQASHHRNVRPAVARNSAAGSSKDPFAGAPHSATPITSPARYQ